MDNRKRCAWAEGHPLLSVYHDTEYGFPIEHDHEFLERLVLELNQAGLSWLTILKNSKKSLDISNNLSLISGFIL